MTGINYGHEQMNMMVVNLKLLQLAAIDDI
jgi:hypothetical protein